MSEVPVSLLCRSLLCRETATARLSEILDGSSTTHVAAIVGDAGIGKTSVTQHVTRNLDRVVLEGRAAPGGPALRALAGIATDAVVAGASVDDESLATLKAGLVALLPIAASAEIPGTTFPFVTAEALLALISTIKAPTTVVIEDLHWADSDTLQAIERLCEHVAARAITVVLVTRPEGEAIQLVRRLRDRRSATEIQLEPLDGDGVLEMATKCLNGPPPDSLLDLLKAADGVPFIVEELLRSAVDAGALTQPTSGVWHFDSSPTIPVPATLNESVKVRFDQLGEATSRVLSVASSLGEGLPLRVLMAAAEASDAEIVEAIRCGIDAQLLDESSVDIKFRHALTEDAALARLVPVERQRAATRALQSLKEDPSGVDPAVVAKIATRAHQFDEAAQWHLTAGSRHAVAAAATAALGEIERGLEVAQDQHLLTQLRVEYADLLALVGRHADAMHQAQLAATSLDLTPDDSIRIDIAIARACGPGPTRSQAAGRAIVHSQSTHREAHVLATVALLAIEGGDLDTAEALAQSAMQSTQGDFVARCQALEVLGRVARGRDLDEADARFSEAAAIAEANRLPLWHARALHERATIAQLRDCEMTDLHQARLVAIEAGAPGLIAAIDFHIAALHATRFEAGEALIAARRFLDLSASLGNPQGNGWGWILVGFAHTIAGSWSKANAALDEAAYRARDDLEVRVISDVLINGLGPLLRGDQPKAAEGYVRAMNELSVLPVLTPHPPWYLGPVLATVFYPHDDRILELANRPELQITGVVRAPWILANAIAAGQRDEPHQAEGFLKMAEMEWASRPALTPYRRLALWIAADCAHRDGWGDAVEWLFEAEAWASGNGYDGIVDAARSKLRNFGATPRRRRGATAIPQQLARLGLTGREIDVLALTGNGLTNADIANRLHLSAGTVKGYISTLIAKTGARNRAGLARVAAQNGLGADDS